jgi:uncharacterized protein (DUF342 family)
MVPNESSTQTRQRAKITVSSDSMSATVMLIKPHEDELPITLEEVMEEIKKAEVVEGINHEAIKQCVDGQSYHNPVVIATGTKPVKGENSTFTYHFDTSSKGKPKEDKDGRIDYKNISFIQNTEKEAVLVTKTPPTPGVPGITVRGKDLQPPSGADIPFKKGKNTVVSDDGLTLIAAKSGAILFTHGTVAVNDLTIIAGNVDHTTGNIDCRGSVKVSGTIKAGFSLTIDGDLEVRGNVEECQIDVGGNVNVKGGFFGKRSGIMKAGGDINVKYAEGQRLAAGGSIYAENEVNNCDVVAGDRVVVKARKGKIIGGTIKCRNEIRAADIGSETGTITHVHVAYDPKLMKKHVEAIQELERLQADGKRVKQGLVALYRLQQDGALPPDKQQALAALEEFKKDLPANLKAMESQKADVEEKLREAAGAMVAAQNMLYPGVTVHFGIVYKEIIKEHSNCKLTMENNGICLSSLGTPTS